MAAEKSADKAAPAMSLLRSVQTPIPSLLVSGFLLGVNVTPFHLLPGLRGLAEMPRTAILREIGAGLSVAAVAIPIGLAYARITGVPTQIGLYASIVPTLVYALVGPSSRYLIV